MMNLMCMSMCMLLELCEAQILLCCTAAWSMYSKLKRWGETLGKDVLGKMRNSCAEVMPWPLAR